MQTDVSKKLRDRVRLYLGKATILEVSENAPAAIVLAPIEAGISRFIDVSNLPSIDDLPFIPERMRDFAFRYATEYKPTKVWAKEYGVHPHTVEKWLTKKGVRAYIAASRYEQRIFNLAQRVSLNRQVYATINKILQVKLTADTIDPIGKMVRFLFAYLNNPSQIPPELNQHFNINVLNGGLSSQTQSDNPYRRPERDVTPSDLKKLDDEYEELINAAGELGISLKDDGDI
jgi:hypothetical protein